MTYKTEYLLINNVRVNGPSSPGDNRDYPDIVEAISEHEINELSNKGWNVVSVSWRGPEIVGALFSRTLTV